MNIKEKLGDLTDLFGKAKEKYGNMNLDDLKKIAREKGILGQSEEKGEEELRNDLAKSESQESSTK